MPCCGAVPSQNDNVPRVPFLRLAWISAGILFSIVLISCGGSSGRNQVGNPPVPFSLSVSPSSLNIVPNSSFTLTISSSGGSGSTTITLGSLPAGLTTDAALPLQIAGGSAAITFKAAANLPLGSSSIVFNGKSGSSTSTATLPVSVKSTPTGFFFPTPIFREVGVPTPGSGQIQFSTLLEGPATNYDIALSISGLPAGTTASLKPATILAGQTSTVTITATAGAPLSRNVSLTLTGTPQAAVPTASISFLVDVTPPPGSLPNNRTDYLSLEGSPYSAVYDRLHNLIFASNPSWNRVVVISNARHAIVKSIPIPDSRAVDISQDSSRVWVGTGGNQVYEINTNTFSAIRHTLPPVKTTVNFGPQPWEDLQIFALADGTLMLSIRVGGGGGGVPIVWDPVLNSVTVLNPPPPAIFFDFLQRTGDGKRVYWFPGPDGLAFFYDVVAKSFSTPVNIGIQPATGAVNFDGSRVLADLAMYDGNFNFLGNIPGGGVLGGPLFDGGTVFSPDTGLLYEVSMPVFTPLILTIDPATLNAVNVAPAMPMIPAGDELSPPFFMPVPFAVDGTGMVLGLQDYGIAFDDSTYTVDLSVDTPGTPIFLQHMSPLSGPLSGGTTSGGFGNLFSLTPDVWYGTNRGIANISTANTLTITSPPASAPGPVNVKMLFPNGIEIFDPLFFSYGPFVQTSVRSGAAPGGGSTGQIAGYGLPANASQGTLTVGGSPAAITASSPRIRSLEVGGYPFPSGTVDFTVPAGSPGFADVTVTTPAGLSTLPKAIYYARSVTDFSSADTFTAVLYDGKRQQLYLSAGDHIDVFSLTAGQFVAPLTPPSSGPIKEFTGMALSLDGSTLLAADLLDGSLGLINPDNPAVSSFIPVAPIDASDPRCTRGPLYVASTLNSKAYVATGGLPAVGCGPDGQSFEIDLIAKTSAAFFNTSCNGGGVSVSASGDGSKLAFSDCIYDVITQTFSARFDNASLETMAADGNIAGGFGEPTVFSDVSGNIIGRVAPSDVNFGSVLAGPTQAALRREKKLNDSGSLLYQPWPQFFDIVDVRHGTLTMRFSLPQTVSDVAVPLALDSGGRHVYLITDRGLTIIDLGSAPLSVGSLSPSTGSPGAQITVLGSGFDPLISATLGNQPAVVTVIDENTMSIIVPPLAPGPADLTLSLSDGRTYTAENVLTVQ